MNKRNTPTGRLPTDKQPEEKREPLYMSGDIFKKNFHPNGTERNKLAKQQAMSELDEMLNKSQATPSEPANPPNHTAPKVRQAAYSPSSEEADNEVYLNPKPKVPEGAFPPNLQSAVDAACHSTEAHPMAVAGHYVSGFAAHIGACRYIRIGNEKHSLDFYALLVGFTGEVKGTAQSQFDFIEQLAIQRLRDEHGYTPPRKLSGLSSGEGLIEAIRDPDDSEEADNGKVDKRVMITESEYANVLTQDQRGGNTLSIVLRDAYDGKTLSNMTVASRTATSPHISIMGHITPGELLRHKSFMAQSVNGALNRNLIIFGYRPRPTSNPRAYSNEEANDLSHWFAEAIHRARGGSQSDNYTDQNAGLELTMHPEALAVIDKEYFKRETARSAMPEMLRNLTSRHRVIVRRLSAIFALMDGTDTIGAVHVRQAYRWLDYSLDSIRYLLGSAKQEVKQEEVISLADIVHNFLLSYNNGEGASTTEIHRHLFKNNKKAKDFAPALEVLIDSTPPRIEILRPDTKGRGNRKTIFKPIKTK